YHSSYFREDAKQLLVYIKPIHNADDWKGGIVVLVEHLIPIRIRDKNSNTKKTRETINQPETTRDN
ncbi:MAG: hypothetical protein QNJ32_25675, partial [Xenococcaceae cyanobacterium MO_167.B27]|nr:hypothetical protein [Xenococcaceae cyanobacterium MO_167.B27]